MSDDLISRKAVVDLIDKLGYINVSNHDDFRANCRMDKIRQEVSELPTSFEKPLRSFPEYPRKRLEPSP